MRRTVRFVAIALTVAISIPALAGAYADEENCFNGTVPNPPAGSASVIVSPAGGGSYVATAWRQSCNQDASQLVLLIQFRALTGSPSAASVMVRQGGLTYDGFDLIKNPTATLLLDWMLIGRFSGTVNTIVRQYLEGPRFDPSGRLTIKFGDISTVLGDQEIVLPAAPQAQASASVDVFYGNMTDMWWNPDENGTGVSVIQHGSNQLFIVWYTYNDAGEPLWLVWPGGTWTDNRTFTGSLFRPRGTTFSRPWDASAFAVGTPVGTATIKFTGADVATLTYSVGSTSGTKNLTRQRY